MSKMYNNYIGKAGQFYAMSEFLMLGWNVAIPEVDRGDDIFVVKDADGALSRIQVKTAQARKSKKGYTAQFLLPRQQIEFESTPEINFLLLIRHDGNWKRLLAIKQSELYGLLTNRLSEEKNKVTINLRISFEQETVMCGEIDFSRFSQLSRLFTAIHH